MKSLFHSDHQAFIRYEDLPGAGSGIVFLAGLIWASQAAFLPVVAREPALARRRTLFIDLFGTGFSDAPGSFGYGLEDHAQTVARILLGLGLNDCTLVGYSIGGPVAILVATLQPALVSRVVLLEPNLDPLGPGQGMVTGRIMSQTEEAFCAGGFQVLLASFRAAGSQGDETAAATAGILQVAPPFAVYRSAAGLARGTTPSARQLLYDLDLPRSCVFGARTLPHPDWDRLAGHGIQVLSVPDAGHGMAWENPSGVARAIAAALS